MSIFPDTVIGSCEGKKRPGMPGSRIHFERVWELSEEIRTKSQKY